MEYGIGNGGERTGHSKFLIPFLIPYSTFLIPMAVDRR
jgi:hypothetical protein